MGGVWYRVEEGFYKNIWWDVVGRMLFWCSEDREISGLLGRRGVLVDWVPRMTLSNYLIHHVCWSLKLRQRVSKDMCSSRMSDHAQKSWIVMTKVRSTRSDLVDRNVVHRADFDGDVVSAVSLVNSRRILKHHLDLSGKPSRKLHSKSSRLESNAVEDIVWSQRNLL
jgi:hypothetical protein